MSNTSQLPIILGGGVTGLAAGYASGLPVYEANSYPGGICASYYINGYRFEVGGGHWIFGGDPMVHAFMQRLAPMQRHARLSGVWFPNDKTYVPYPIQNHLRFLPAELAQRALAEMTAARPGKIATMDDWMTSYFGPTLCETFFRPFHNLYTAGLYKQIAPQDSFKSPIDLAQVKAGATGSAASVGYNTTYLYPTDGLDAMMRRMADGCHIEYNKCVVGIDVQKRSAHFADGSSVGFRELICTLPLNRALELTGLAADVPADPYTSVLVLNIGAVKARQCPKDHWLYHPTSHSGFHRVGFYSNVDASFLPESARAQSDRVSIYVERAFKSGQKPSADETADYQQRVVRELQDWGFIEEAEVVDPTWIDVAYTWAWPGSSWRGRALRLLEEHGIYMVGRYGRWTFQGIAESIRDGFIAGGSFRSAGKS